MSDNIDRKVVEMRFDNKQFENNVKTSMSTLDKLKEKLSFKNSSKDFDNLNSSIRKVDFNPLSKAVENVGIKFDALHVVATTALVNITNSAVNAGKKLVSAFTIDPIKTGFQEYETLINSVQTILANTSSKGTTLEDVNTALDELNTYADKTIYNFTEMTRNIGTFTAAGVNLKTSTSAIQGIANLAAISGSTSQQASTAMYQLSQALSSGTVKLMDWNSVVNAGMGGEVFQNALKETARLHGVAIDEMIKNEGSFRETLSNGWLTSDVLTETLKKFTTSGVNEYLSEYTNLSTDSIAEMRKQAVSAGDTTSAYKEMAKSLATNSKLTENQIYELLNMSTTAEDAATKVKTFTQLMDTLKEAAQSGWTQTWEIIVGDFEEAKSLFTEVSDFFGDIISKSSDTRNNVLDGAMSTGWEQLKFKVEKTGISFEQFQNELKVTAKAHSIAIDDMIEKDGSLEKSLKRGWLNGDIISETLYKYIGIVNEASNSTETVTTSIENLGEVVNRVIRGDFGNGVDRITALTEAGYDYATVQDLVNKTLSGEEISYDNLSNAQLTNMGYTEDQIQTIRELAEEAKKTGTPINELIQNMSKPSGRELLIDSFRNALKGLMTVIGSVKQAWTDIFPPMTSDRLYSIIENVHKLSEYLVINNENTDKLKRTFKGLFAAIDIVRTIAGGALKTALSVIAKIFGIVDINVLDVTASVGDAIVAFRDWLFENNKFVKGVAAVIEWVAKACVQIKEWIDTILALPAVQAKITEFKNTFIDILSSFEDYFNGGIVVITDFINRIKDMNSISLDNIGDIFKDFKDNVLGYFFDINRGFGKLGEALTKFKDGIKSQFEAIISSLTGTKTKIFDFIDSIVEKFGGVAVSGLLTVGFGAALITFANTLWNVLGAVGNIKDGFVGVLKDLSGVLNAYTNNIRADSLIKIATAIAILAGSVALISLIDKDKLWGSVGALGALAGGLAGLAVVTALLPKLNIVNTSMTAIISLAGAVLILVIAIKKMEEIDSTKVLGKLGTITILITELTLVSAVLSKVAPNLKGSCLAIIAFSAGILILVEALDRLSFIKSDGLLKNVAGLMGIVLGLIGLVAVCNKIKFKDALSILAVVTALKMLVGIVDNIGSLDIKYIFKNILNFIAIFAMFKILTKASQNAGEFAAKGGAGILLMSGAMVIMSIAFKQLAKIDASTIGRSLLAISSMLIIFGGITALSKLAGKYAVKAGTMILLMSGAIAILAGVMWGLSLLDPSGLKRALIAIVSLEAVFGALIGISKLATDCQKTLIVLVVAVGILSIALGVLSMLPIEGIKAATIAITAVTVAFTLLVGISKLASNCSGPLIAMIAAVTLLSVALWLLAGLPTETAITNAGALSTLMLSLSAALVLIGAAKTPSFTAIGALAGIVLVVGVLAGVIGTLEACNMKVSIENAVSLSILVLALSGACLILASVGAVAGAALIGIGILSAFIVGMGLIMFGIGALANEFPSIDSSIDTACAIFEKIGEGLGAIVGGALAGLTAGLPQISQNLSEFMVGLEPFIASVKSIDQSTVDSANALASMIASLTGASFLNGIMDFIGFGDSGFASLGENLLVFGEALLTYTKVISPLTDSDVEKITLSATAGSTLSSLLNEVPNSGGALAELVGDNTWDTFRAGLPEFGAALVNYATSVSKLDDNKIKAIDGSVNAGSALADLLNEVPNSGGALAELVGDNTWDTFKNGLPEFGLALVDYATSVLSLDNTKIKAIDTSVSASAKLVELLNSLPNSGGLAASIIGDNTWVTFMDGLVAFGGQLTAYSIIVGNCHLEAIQDSVSATTGLISVLNALPNSGGMASWFAGDNTWTDFGKGLVEFAGTLRDYATEVKDLDNTSIALSAVTIGKLTDVLNNLPEKPKKSVKEFAKSINSIGEGLNNYCTKTLNADLSKATESTILLGKITNVLNETSKIDTNGVAKLGNGMTSLGNLAVDRFTTNINNSFNKIKMVGTDFITTFIDAINLQKDTLKSSLGEIKDTIEAFFKDLSYTMKPTIKDEFNNFGNYMVDGLVNGIDGSSSLAKAAIEKLADDTMNTFRDKMGIHSPSKIFEAIGNFLDQGLSKGIDGGSGGVLDVLSGLGNSITDKMSSFTSNLSESGLDLGSIFGNMLGDNTDINSLIGDSFNLDSLNSLSDYDFTTLDSESSALFTSAKKELDALLENYQNGKIKQAEYDKRYTALLKKYSSIQASLSKYAIEKILPSAQKEYDAILENYKNGKINQAEYDEKYLKLLKKYKAAEIDVYKYAQGRIASYISDSITDRSKQFEDELKSIQDKIDSYSSKMTNSFESMMTYTTNKSVFDEKTTEYEKNLKTLNNQRDKAVELYGEESAAATSLQTRIDTLSKSYEKYKTEYEDSGVDDNEIIGVKFTNQIKQSTREIIEYTNAIKALQEKGMSSAMIDSIASMDREQGLATVNYLSSLSEKELKAVSQNWDKYTNATAELSETLYRDEVKTATQNYVDDVVTALNSLPDSASAIGANMVKGLALGFSIETEKSLSSIGQSAESITTLIKSVFGIHSPSRVFKKEIGSNLAAGLSQGFIETMKASTKAMIKSVPTDFNVNKISTKGFSNTISKLADAVKYGIDAQPTIRPVLDLSEVKAGAKTINTMMSRNQAIAVNSSFENSRNVKPGTEIQNGVGSSSSFTFNQYNTSPKALSRKEIRNDTIQGLQLSRAMR